MNNNAQARVLKALRNARNIHTLKSALQALCEPSGPVTSHQVIFNTNRRVISCLLRMKSPLPDSEMQELGELGAYSFGDLVRLEFPAGARFRESTRTSP